MNLKNQIHDVSREPLAKDLLGILRHLSSVIDAGVVRSEVHLALSTVPNVTEDNVRYWFYLTVLFWINGLAQGKYPTDTFEIDAVKRRLYVNGWVANDITNFKYQLKGDY